MGRTHAEVVPRQPCTKSGRLLRCTADDRWGGVTYAAPPFSNDEDEHAGRVEEGWMGVAVMPKGFFAYFHSRASTVRHLSPTSGQHVVKLLVRTVYALQKPYFHVPSYSVTVTSVFQSWVTVSCFQHNYSDRECIYLFWVFGSTWTKVGSSASLVTSIDFSLFLLVWTLC